LGKDLLAPRKKRPPPGRLRVALEVAAGSWVEADVGLVEAEVPGGTMSLMFQDEGNFIMHV
jgi:hypothetical protein